MENSIKGKHSGLFMTFFDQIVPPLCHFIPFLNYCHPFLFIGVVWLHFWHFYVLFNTSVQFLNIFFFNFRH